jgi:hypothetical protein
VTFLGIRSGVWLAVAALAGGGLALGLGLRGAGATGEGSAPRAERAPARSELAARAAAGRGTRIRIGALELGGHVAPSRGALEGAPANARVGFASDAGSVVEGDVESRIGGASSRVALSRAPAMPRPGELVSLEREALRSLSALPREDADALAAEVAAELAVLEPEPGESPRAFEERREDARGRLVSDELLLRARLAELYAQQVYPYGFPVERIVAWMERQLVQALPAADRAAALRQLAESGPPARPRPRFETAESGLVYRGGPGL